MGDYTATAAAVRALATGILAALPTQRPATTEPDDLDPPPRPGDLDEAAVIAAMGGPAVVTTAERAEAVRRLNRQGMTDPQIAARMRRNKYTIRRIRRINAIPAAVPPGHHHRVPRPRAPQEGPR